MQCIEFWKMLVDNIVSIDLLHFKAKQIRENIQQVQKMFSKLRKINEFDMGLLEMYVNYLMKVVDNEVEAH